MAIQADGKILVGGAFTGLGGGTGATLRANIGRLNSDGLVDMGFNPGAESQVLTLGVQADGKILAGGYFQLLGGGGGGSATRKYIGRLDANGLIDPTFNPGAGNVVNALAVQPDGAVVVGGVFPDGRRRNRNGDAASPHRAVHEHRRGGSKPGPVEWQHCGDLGSQRGRAGSLERYV